MEIKGNIGEKIYVPAIIETIVVTESEVNYLVTIGNQQGYQEFKENDIKFEDAASELPWVEPKPAKPDVIETAVAIPKAEVPKDSRVVIPQTLKRRGRPKKATVEDLVKKAEKIGGKK